MKKSIMIVAVACLAAAGAWAQGVVTSVNIVGYQKYTFEIAKTYLVSTAFEDIDGKILYAKDVFGTQLPFGSRVHYLDTSVVPAAKLVDPYNSRGWGSNIVFRGGMGFWVQMPPTPPVATPGKMLWDVVLMGQVPTDSTHTNAIVLGMNQMGYPYTADVKFGDTELFRGAGVGDKLYIYNPTISPPWTPYNRTSRGWSAAASNLVLRQGMGFWYETVGTPRFVVEARPYTP